MANKAILVQGGDGTAIPSNMVGEDLSVMSGNVSVGTDWTTLCSKTLNKGSYLISATGRGFVAATLQGFEIKILVGGAGGTTVGKDTASTATNSVGACSVSLSNNIVNITSDGTVVVLQGKYDTNTLSTYGYLSIIRIA